MNIKIGDSTLAVGESGREELLRFFNREQNCAVVSGYRCLLIRIDDSIAAIFEGKIINIKANSIQDLTV